MDEVVGWLVVALLKLVFWLFKLAFRVLWFAATGKWVNFGRDGQVVAGKGQQPAKVSGRKRARSAEEKALERERRRALRGAPAEPPASFPFEFAPEQVALEPMAEWVEQEPRSEEEALLLERRRALLRKARERAQAKLQRPAVAHPGRSLRAAIRDRDTLRKAVVLGAALAPRRPF